METKYMRKKGFICLLVAGLCLALESCKDEWDNHFDAKGANASGVSLMDMVGQEESLGRFAEILRLTGADSYLASNQTYTVWAPTDEALAGVDMDDMDELNRIVGNHIARYSSPSSTSAGDVIYMLNGKAMSYSTDGSFNGVELLERDIVAQNGVLHVIGGQIPYQYNLLEYISTHENYDSLYKYVMFFHELRYDEAQSTAYDSVFVDYNPMLEHYKYGIGYLGNEDSIYTMVIPDNAAWREAYERISPYFRVYGTPEYADSVMRIQAAQAILNGLTFRGRVTDPAGADSLRTVTSNVIYKTGEYFAGYSSEAASNGLMCFANGHLNMDDTCTWNHKITVEAEDPDTRTESNATGYIRQVDSDEDVPGVSQSYYLEVEGSVRSDGGIIFNIPNVLAGKYDVYVDFVPPIIDGEAAAQKKCRVQFQMSYINPATGKSKVDSFVKDDDWVIGGTEDNSIVTIKAYEGYEFELGEFYDGMWYCQEGNTTPPASNIKIQVRTNVTSSELKADFVRTFRVDRIRFVPVE